MIPDDTVDRVREGADIVQIIGEYVKLKRVGTSYRGPCPFHHGKDPNLSIIPGKGYKCFVCGESGNVFTFLQKHLGLDFVGAVKLAGEKSGIEVVEVEQRRREGPDPRERLWEVIAAAAEFFTRSLWQDDQSQMARDYLAGRRVSRDTADRFGIGFAPRDVGVLRQHLETLGFDAERQLEAGLLARREDSPELRARFRGRLMFPIWDERGHPVGFGGRSLDATEPKYLNSAESSIFNKGRLLYALNWAKNSIRKEERVLLVEGYFDALRLMTAGIEATVAPLGTALTEDQARLLVRYTRNVFLLYDSDRAGLKATFRAGDELLRHGASVRVVTLPEGEDPDTFVDKFGRERMENELAAAIDVFERKVQLLERGGWFADLHRKRRAIDRLLPTIRATADPLMRDLYLSRVSEAARVDKELLLREANEPSRPRSSSRSKNGGGSDARQPVARTTVSADGFSPPMPRQLHARFGDRRRGDRRHGPDWASSRAPMRGSGSPGVGPERDLTRLMLHVRGFVESVAERYGPESFRDDAYASIFAALLELGADARVEQLATVLDADVIPVLESLLAESEALGQPQSTFERSIAVLRVRELEARNEEIDREQTLASGDDKDVLMQEKRRNMEEISSLGGIGYRKFGKSRS